MINKITVVIKTILRYNILNECIKCFKNVNEGLRILVIDDTPVGHRCILDIPNVRQVFVGENIGVSAGRNMGFNMVNTKYIWYSDDDHIFENISWNDVEQCLGYIIRGECDLIGGKSAMFVDDGEGNYKCINVASDEVKKVDITGYLFLSTKEFLVKNPHLEECKIMGDHFSFFYNIKRNGGLVFTSPLLSHKNSQSRNPLYSKFRNRNYRKIMIEKLGIKSLKW